MRIAISLLLAVTIGVVCRLTGIPVPAPHALVGALLVLSMTVGYLTADHFANGRPGADGPTGSQREEN